MIRIILFLLWVSLAEAKPVEIIFWHSFAGRLGHDVTELVQKFNHLQPDYVIKPIYKGDYLETLTSFAAAFQAKQPPALVQIFEVGTPTMLAPQGIVKPVYKLMEEERLSLPTNDFFPAIRNYYSQDSKLMAMPFNVSIPIMYYNREAIEKVGYNTQSFPRSWDELENLADRLKNSGFACVYTTSYPSWTLLEAFAAMHGLAMLNPTRTAAVYDNQLILNHLKRLLNWKRKHFFEYAGRTDEATALFTSQRCPLISQSSGVYKSLLALIPFKLGIAPLPIDATISTTNNMPIIGGGALWAVAGQTKDTYKGIAKFLQFLASADTQKWWHERTGYLPLGLTGSYQTIMTNTANPILELAKTVLLAPGAAEKSNAGMQNQLRLINDEALEAIFAEIKTPQQALDDAVLRANNALHSFSRNTREH